MPRTPTTSASDWLEAAYGVFKTRGLAAVRVETLAAEIGTTKGSFYWHYADRRALIDAVMARWEAEHTNAIIEVSAAADTPKERIVILFQTVAALYAGTHIGEARLYTEAAAEGVTTALANVTERRIAYLAELLAEAGFTPSEARDRSTIALASVVGLQQLYTSGAAQAIDRDSLTAAALAMTLDPH